jgi:adenylosuccinate synthase
MFANVNVEERRGEKSHSSTGCGVWETICRHKALAPKFSQSMYAWEDIVAYYEEVLKDENGVLPENVKEFLHGDCLKDNIDEDFTWFYEHVTIIKDQWEETQLLHSYPLLVFENGQGLLLDDRYSRDINHNTPAYVGMVEAERILNQNFLRTEVNVEALYVTRTYYTRHGKGQIGLWSNCECDKDDINPRMFDATNVPNPNQGTLRYGKIDELEAKAVAARAVNDSISPFFDVTTSMVITHCNEYMNDYLFDAAKDQNLNTYVSYDETNIRKV